MLATASRSKAGNWTARLFSRFAGLSLRKILPCVMVAVAAGFAIHRLKFAPATVVAYEVKLSSIVAEVMGTGTLEARVKTTISPRIQERLAEVLVDQNDTVKAGQMLARLDDGELKLQVEVATAALASARASVDRVKADEVRVLAVAHLARVNHQRVEEMHAKKVVSEEELDRAVEQLKVAEADVNRTRAAIVEAERQVGTAQKNLLFQDERLGFTQIVSPYDGLIVRRDRDPGGVVLPGASILQLISTGEIWVSAWVDETASAALNPGQPARVIFRSEPAKSYSGEVVRLGRETDRETREFLVDVRVNELPNNWTIGQRAEVFIETGRNTSALGIPQQFLHWRDGKAGVFVNDNGKARWRAVTLGLRGRDTVEIVQGVTAGERLAAPADPKTGLTDGRRIEAR